MIRSSASASSSHAWDLAVLIAAGVYKQRLSLYSQPAEALNECCVTAQASVSRFCSPSKILPWPAARQAALGYCDMVVLPFTRRLGLLYLNYMTT